MNDAEQLRADKELLNVVEALRDARELTADEEQRFETILDRIAEAGGIGHTIDVQGIRGTRSRSGDRVRLAVINAPLRQKLLAIRSAHNPGGDDTRSA